MKINRYAWLERADAKVVRAVRKHGLNVVARVARVSPAQLSVWLRGKGGMSLDKVDRVLEAVGLEDRKEVKP